MNPKIQQLIELADLLDARGEVEAANEIDQEIQKMAGTTTPTGVSDNASDGNAYSNIMSNVYAQLRTLDKQSAMNMLKELSDMFARTASVKTAELSEEDQEHLEALEEERNELLTYERYAQFDEGVMDRVERIDKQIEKLKETESKEEPEKSLEAAMASLSEIADTLDKNGAIKEADKIDEFLAKYGEEYATDVKWQEKESDKYDTKKHHEQQIKQPKEKHKQGPDKHHVEEYEPGEGTLSTRYCPKHPSVMMARVGEGVYQCSVDGEIINWEEGYTDADGNKVPGGSVAGQTPQSTNYFATPSRFFDHRQDIINRIH